MYTLETLLRPTLANGRRFDVIHFVDRVKVVLIVVEDPKVVLVVALKNNSSSHVVGLEEDRIASESGGRLVLPGSHTI